MKKLPVLVAAVVILTAAGLGSALYAKRYTLNAKASASYYCPMHPSYTANKPGSCPICNMTLVKRENASVDPHEQASAQFKTICYLHNCGKIHQGQPCPMTVVAKPGEKVTCPICGSHVAEAEKPREKQLLYWTDPMIPSYKADKPGKSPMGMDLVPVYAEETASTAPSANTPEGYAPVLVTPEKQQLIGIKTEPAAKRALQKTIRAVGIVAHDPELYQAEQELIQAVHAWEQAKAGPSPEVAEQAKGLADSSRLRLRHLGLTDSLIDEVATWPKPDERLLLGGAGQYWVYASIYEYELSLVRSGQAVTVNVSALGGETFPGMVKAIDPMLDPMTRTARVRILVEDPKGLLKPSMYVNVAIAVDLGEGIAVAEEAVFATGTQSIVFVDKGLGLFEPRQVTLGSKADGYYEVKDGVAEGEPVVTSGNFLIDSESRLKGALQGSGEHQHGQ